MVLGWKQPDKSGGAEITGYYVNYREVTDGKPGPWREANVKAVSEEAYKVSVWHSVSWLSQNPTPRGFRAGQGLGMVFPSR